MRFNLKFLRSILFAVTFFVVFMSAVQIVSADVIIAAKTKSSDCTTIQSGLLTAIDGTTLTTGYDQWGYNYQTHTFNGYYPNSERSGTPATEGNSLIMKWNDAWLSNVDCNGDKKLDRPYGFPEDSSFKGSGAWYTNHQSGTYLKNGEVCKWTYSAKIVAVPLDATEREGVWYTADGIEIGPVAWENTYAAIIQRIWNDPCAGESGLYSKGDTPTGLGFYKL